MKIKYLPLFVPASVVLCSFALVSPSVAQSLPSCVSDVTDPDGDGFGFENGRSCLVDSTTGTTTLTTPTSQTLPSCVSDATDPDGDGFGFENGASCLVDTTTTTTGTSIPTTPTTQTLPSCVSDATDPDGDGFGFENNRSCIVDATTTPTGSTGTTTPTTPVSPQNQTLASCLSDATDPDGDGFGFENGASCLVDATTTTTTVTTPTTPIATPFPQPELIDIQAGCFDIGSPLDEPLRSDQEGPQVNLCVQSFRMARYEVTFEQYDAYANDTGQPLPDDAGFGRGSRPVINVDWDNATAYAVWLSEQTGQNYRLPTEAEWEYAARAGTSTPFSTGQTITSDQANFDATLSYNGSPVGEFREQTIPVGSFSPNAFGLFDMHGNAREWTCSAFVGDYRSLNAPQACETGSEGTRVLRGGDWQGGARFIRSATRSSLSTSVIFEAIGFRVVQQ